MEKTYQKIISEIKKYFKENNFKKAVIGLSGGIDSSLSAVLTAKAIGSENILGILMPESGLTRKENVNDAIELAKFAKIKYTIIPINKFIQPFKGVSWKINKIAHINTKSRIRANILYNYANNHNALVIGTSNKTEIALGYFTKYGDGACDIEIIGSLYKTEVINLSKFLKLPENVITKQPTAELFHGQTDEKELGANYQEIDKILKTIKNKTSKSKLEKEIIKRINQNKHKTESIPIIKAK